MSVSTSNERQPHTTVSAADQIMGGRPIRQSAPTVRHATGLRGPGRSHSPANVPCRCDCTALGRLILRPTVTRVQFAI